LARRRKDWIGLQKNRWLETASVHVRDTNGWPLKRPGPHLAGEDRVRLIPGRAYCPVTRRRHASWCFTLAVRILGLSKVQTLVSFEHESLTERSVVLGTSQVDWGAAKIIPGEVSLEALTRWLRIDCRSRRVLLESATFSR
jgi:hypothetical protein